MKQQPRPQNPASKQSPLQMKCTINRAFVKAKAGSSVFVALDLTPTPRPAVQNRRNLSLAIDASGSMDGEKIDHAKQAALGLVKQLRPNDLISIVSFSDAVDLKLPTSPVGDSRAAAAAISSITVKGLTAMHKGLDLAFQQASQNVKAPGTVTRVLLLTDGNPTVGKTEDRDFVKLAHGMRESGITVTAIGIGSDYNESLLTQISETAGGMWLHIKDPRNDLPQIFQEQAVQMASTVVSNPVLKVAMMPGAELADAYSVKPVLNRLPRPQVTNGAFTIALKDLVVGQEQNLVFRIGLSAKPAGQAVVLRAVIEDVVQDVGIMFTDNEKQAAAETNPYPRMLLSSAEATVLMQKAVQGRDAAAMQKAEAIMKTATADPAASAAARSNPVLNQVVTTMKDAQASVAKSGLSLSEDAKKDFLQQTTVIGRRKPTR